MLVDIPNLQERYYQCSLYRPTKEFNYILSGANTMVAFISAEKEHSSLISVLDLTYNPIFTYETETYIHGCNISSDGKYIVWITASGISPNQTDADSITLFDTENMCIVWQTDAPRHCRFLNGLYIFEETNTVEVIYTDATYKYNIY